MASMSDILRDFTPNELKVFKCFVNPKYPSAIRSLPAVVKESGLEESEVLKIYATYDQILFSPVDDTENKWCFNVTLFAKKFAEKYPDIFEKFEVSNTALGVIIVPKNVGPEVLGQIISQISETDQTAPGISELLTTLNNLLSSKRGDSTNKGIISFSA
jgi:hypothetical protein